MDRLIALVLLRWRMDVRALSLRKERLFGLLLMAPILLGSSLLIAGFAFVSLRALSRTSPDELLPIVCSLAALMAIMWVVSPLVAGVALTESHDMSRLLHFPIPLPVLVASSLVANLAQPMVLAEAPLILAVAAALSDSAVVFPLALAGLLLTLASTLAAAQAVGLLLHGIARNRRYQDIALFVGLAAGFLMSVLPFLVLASGARGLQAMLALTRVFEWVPFAWGARAAAYAGRGEMLPFLGMSALSMSASVVAMGASALLIHLIHRGELDLGGGPRARGGQARMRLRGALGALIEKDLRQAWRDPALRATLFIGLLGPLLILILLSQSPAGARAGSAVLFLASFIGLSGFGGNALGVERRGIGLLLSFPIARWRVLVGKNLAALLFRLPGLLTLLIAVAFTAPWSLAPAALTIAMGTFLIAAGVDNFLSILFPIAIPEPGKNPYAQSSGGRGLGTAMVSALFLAGAGLISAPFAFLAWLPLLLRQTTLWLALLPLSLLGAGAVYALLVGSASRLLERREPEVLERVLGEA